MNKKSSVFYLSAEVISSSACVFSARFAEVANITDCIILANSLSEAVNLLYCKLPPSYERSFIDSTLLEIKFVSRLASMRVVS